MTVMVAVLRSHGATMVERHGRRVAAHFGSATSEAAVCRSRVGLAERSDRATLEVRGPRVDVDRALAELARLGGRAWWARMSTGRAIIRCEGEDDALCTSVMLRADSASVRDVSGDYAAFDLIGPLAGEVLEAAAVDEDEDPAIVLHESEACVELLVARRQGPSMWNRMLEAGAPSGIACVGLDALEHLAVSEHVTRLRAADAQATGG